MCASEESAIGTLNPSGKSNSGQNLDLFGPGSNFDTRFIKSHDELAKRIAALREVRPGIKIVLAMGGYDIKHVGHDRYLERAKEQGDIVVVGVDSNEKIQKRKGTNRPVVDERERMEQLCHLRHVDLVTLKHDSDEEWNLIKKVKPDVLIATQNAPEEQPTYSSEEICELRENWVGQVVVFEPQAQTSTTARIRRLLLNFKDLAFDLLDGITENVGAIKQTLSDALEKDSR